MPIRFTIRLPAKCLDCGTTEKPHKAHGFCDTCYRRYLKKKRNKTIPSPVDNPLDRGAVEE